LAKEHAVVSAAVFSQKRFFQSIFTVRDIRRAIVITERLARAMPVRPLMKKDALKSTR